MTGRNFTSHETENKGQTARRHLGGHDMVQKVKALDDSFHKAEAMEVVELY